MSLGSNIKKARNKIGLTQKELAQQLGLAEITIRQYETDKRQPKLDFLDKIADALGVDVWDLYNNYSLPAKEVSAIHKAAENITDERKAEIEEKRLNNLMKRKAKDLNNAGIQKTVDYMTDLSGNPEYQKDPEK